MTERLTGKREVRGPAINSLEDHAQAYEVQRPAIPTTQNKVQFNRRVKIVNQPPPKVVRKRDHTLREAAPNAQVQLLDVSELLLWAKEKSQGDEKESPARNSHLSPRPTPRRPATCGTTRSWKSNTTSGSRSKKPQESEHLSPSPRRQFQSVGSCTLRNGLVARRNNMCAECLALDGAETEAKDSSPKRLHGSGEGNTPPAEDAVAEAGWRCTQCRVPSKPECHCQRCDACHELSWFCSCVTCFQCKKPFPNRLQYDEDTRTTRGRTQSKPPRPHTAPAHKLSREDASTRGVDFVAEGAAQRGAAYKALPPPQSHPAPKGTPYCKGINRGFKFNAVGRPTLYPNRVLKWQVPEAHTVVPGGWKRRKIPPPAVGKEGDAGPCRVVAGKLYTFESHASRGHFLSVPSVRAGAHAMLTAHQSVWLAQAAGAGGAFHFVAVASPLTQSEPLVASDAPCLVSNGMDLLTLLQPKNGDTQLGTWTLRYVEPEAEESKEGQDPVLEGEQQPVAKTECVKLTVDTGKGQAALDVGPSPSPGSAFSVSALDVTSPPVSQLFIVKEFTAPESTADEEPREPKAGPKTVLRKKPEEKNPYPKSGRRYFIEPAHAKGKTLQPENGGSGRGVVIVLWDQEGSDVVHQQWEVLGKSKKGFIYTFAPRNCLKGDPKSLNCPEAGGSGLCQLWEYSDASTERPDQQWLLTVAPGRWGDEGYFTMSPSSDSTTGVLGVKLGGADNGAELVLGPQFGGVTKPSQMFRFVEVPPQVSNKRRKFSNTISTVSPMSPYGWSPGSPSRRQKSTFEPTGVQQVVDGGDYNIIVKYLLESSGGTTKCKEQGELALTATGPHNSNATIVFAPLKEGTLNQRWKVRELADDVVCLSPVSSPGFVLTSSLCLLNESTANRSTAQWHISTLLISKDRKPEKQKSPRRKRSPPKTQAAPTTQAFQVLRQNDTSGTCLACTSVERRDENADEEPQTTGKPEVVDDTPLAAHLFVPPEAEESGPLEGSVRKKKQPEAPPPPAYGVTLEEGATNPPQDVQSLIFSFVAA